MNGFNPTLKNPLRVKCDDGKYIDGLSELKIVSCVNQGELFAKNKFGKIVVIFAGDLEHYPSQKQPREVILYEHVQEYSGRVAFLNKDGMNVNNKGFPYSYQQDGFKKIKNGRRLRLLDTGEVEEIANEDLR